jgi:hypothetical protein
MVVVPKDTYVVVVFKEGANALRAAIYARYSSDNQREESIDAQIRAIKEYCARNSISIVKVYADEARSATTADRPSFLQLIKDSALDIFDAVIVHKLDRFSRARYDRAFLQASIKAQWCTSYISVRAIGRQPRVYYFGISSGGNGRILFSKSCQGSYEGHEGNRAQMQTYWWETSSRV